MGYENEKNTIMLLADAKQCIADAQREERDRRRLRQMDDEIDALERRIADDQERLAQLNRDRQRLAHSLDGC